MPAPAGNASVPAAPAPTGEATAQVVAQAGGKALLEVVCSCGRKIVVECELEEAPGGAAFDASSEVSQDGQAPQDGGPSAQVDVGAQAETSQPEPESTDEPMLQDPSQENPTP